MMTFIPQPFPWILCVLGLCIFVVSVYQSGNRTRQAVEPLRAAGLSSRNRTAIWLMIMHGRLAPNEAVRDLAFRQVAYNVTVGATLLRWQPFVVLGVVLAICGFYPLPSVSTVAVVIQCIIVLFSANQFRIDRRRLLHSRELVSQGWVIDSTATPRNG
jgi:hypothetical protein